jgi:hypothetical protein
MFRSCIRVLIYNNAILRCYFNGSIFVVCCKIYRIQYIILYMYITKQLFDMAAETDSSLSHNIIFLVHLLLIIVIVGYSFSTEVNVQRITNTLRMLVLLLTKRSFAQNIGGH